MASEGDCEQTRGTSGLWSVRRRDIYLNLDINSITPSSSSSLFAHVDVFFQCFFYLLSWVWSMCAGVIKERDGVVVVLAVISCDNSRCVLSGVRR